MGTQAGRWGESGEWGVCAGGLTRRSPRRLSIALRHCPGFAPLTCGMMTPALAKADIQISVFHV
ncbi:hypothetical protein [Streptomyces sp. AC627_RSS907]|uniref:hypothetical protein n=1 Tax=Streptomyces sp. AC627_RSS907 TaxID=2823684 RepID=UPI001C251137|nr:hypothetical protein [Streptomyces sp. AC627_RSS907]